MQKASSIPQFRTRSGSDGMVPGLRILLAEDNLLNQRLAVRQLSGLGYYCVDVVDNGQATVDAVTCSRVDSPTDAAYHLVLMDCQMPLLDGFAATQAIREWERCHPIPHPIVIIAMTASDLKQDQQQAIEVGMNDYLLKPVRQEDLKSLLERWSQVLLGDALHLDPSDPTTDLIPRDDACLALPLQNLSRLADGCPEFAAELLQIFLQDSYQQLQQLQQAIGCQNFLHIEHLAHHIKGASANLGAITLRQIAEEIERHSQQRQGERLNELVACLEVALRQIEAGCGLDAEARGKPGVANLLS